MTDDEYTALLGPKCPACGHRGGRHRPAGQWTDPCPNTPQETT